MDIPQAITNAMAPHDGVVYIRELDLYVTKRVKALTNGEQKPTTIIPELVQDFAVGTSLN